MASKVNWQDESIRNYLKTAWQSGVPTQKIAEHIGNGCQKHNVITQARQMSLGPHPSKGFIRPKIKKANPSEPVPQPKTACTSKTDTLVSNKTSHESAMLSSSTKTIHTLTENDCRWPIGNPQSKTFCFCGKAKATKADGKKLPYCEFHARKAYQPSSPQSAGRDADKLRRRRPT